MLSKALMPTGATRIWNRSIWLFSFVLFLTASDVLGAEKAVTLKFAVLEGPKAARTIHGHQVWANAVEQAGNSSIKISLFPSASLVSAKQAYDATVNGLVDITCISIGHYPGRFPLTESLSFPGSGIADPVMASEIIMEMYRKYPQMQNEFKTVKVLFFFGFAPMSIATVEKPIRTWEDLDGLRLRVNHKGSANYLEGAGVSPIFIAPPSIFLSLQKRVIDGSVMGWFGHHAFGTTKLANYFTEVPPLPGPFFAYLMNKKKFRRLSQDQKDAIMSVSGDKGVELLGQSALKEIEIATRSIRENPDQEIIQLSRQEVANWSEKASAEQEKIVRKMESRGYPIRQFFQDVKLLVKTKGAK